MNTEGAIPIENEETLGTLGIQDEDKQNKTTTHYVLDTNIRKQTQIPQIRHESLYQEMVVNKNEHSVYEEIVIIEGLSY